MSKLLIIKTGTTLPTLKAEKGDFEDWIVAGMGVSRERVLVVDVCNGAPLPPPAGLAGVVITGSHTMVTEHQPWSERTAEWLRGAVEQQVLMLGICYGHQLLAYALGGEVRNNPRGREFGTVELYLTGAAREDRLLAGFTNPLRVQVCHTQSVTRLPGEARLLGWSAGDPHLAFGIGNRVWGVQFHPEFDTRALHAYVEQYRQELREEGQEPDRILAASEATPYGGQILKRFASIVA